MQLLIMFANFLQVNLKCMNQYLFTELQKSKKPDNHVKSSLAHGSKMEKIKRKNNLRDMFMDEDEYNQFEKKYETIKSDFNKDKRER